MFRFNFRGAKGAQFTDADRFYQALGQISYRRLTYAQVTGKTEERASA